MCRSSGRDVDAACRSAGLNDASFGLDRGCLFIGFAGLRCGCGAIHHQLHGLGYLRLLVLCVRPGHPSATPQVLWYGLQWPRHFLPSLFLILPMPGHFVRVQGWCGAHVDVVQQRQGIQLLGLSHLVMALFPCPCSFMPCGRRVALLDRGMATPCRLCSRFCAQQHTYSDAGFTSEAPAFDTHTGALQVMQQEGTFGGTTAYSRLFCMTAAACSCCFAVL